MPPPFAIRPFFRYPCGMKLTQNILVATDFSNASELALDAARILALQNEAKVTLVHVFDARPPLGFPLGRETGEEEPDHDKELRDRIHAELRRLREDKLGDVPEAKVAVVMSRSAAEGICHYAQKENVDMIVLSTHGRTGLSHLLIGSVAERVVRHAPCPVLTLRSKARD